MQAVFYKGRRMSWYIPGLDRDATIELDPVTFTPDMLPQGRIEQGQQPPLIRIPQIPRGLSTRKDGTIELILESRYDKETRQNRNKKVVIGHDASLLLHGLMIPNDTFFDYFKNDGTPIDPARWQKQKEDQEAEQEESNQPAQNNKQTTQKQNQQQPTQEQEQQYPTQEQSQPTHPQERKQMPEDDLWKKRLALLQKETALNAREQELYEWQEALEM